MYQLREIVLIYFTGGLTFIPILLLILYFSSSKYTPPSTLQAPAEEEEKQKNPYTQQEKKGWIRLTKRYKPKDTSESNVAVLVSGIQSYVQGSKRPKEHVYGQLKCGALFIYESDQPNEECKIIIPVHNYSVSMYPEKKQDHDIFGRSIALRLTPKKESNNNNDNMQILLKGGGQEGGVDDIAASPCLTSNNELFITCARPVDKEDWYFGLLAATEMMSESPTSHVEMMDITHFDASAMHTLISTVQQDAEYREVQWLNAILGRLFLGMYKTKEMRSYFQAKISKKTQKIKRPSFLGEITVQDVDIGNSIPFVTQPKLLSLTPEGELMAEATVHYAGGLRVVIQTDFNWTYSSLMKPIKIPLVLSVTLKKLSGKFMLKVKPPPTNRYWIGFYELPVMDWEITPIVSDKQIRLSMVTNAIQSKIREFMMENVVLPNMDDFPFCPSGGKGGIFGERVPKPSSPKESASSSPALSMDMLGNKVNQQKAPPKVIVTQDSSFDAVLQQTLPKPPTRRAESLGVLLDTPSMLTDQIMKNRRSKSTSPSDIQHIASMLRSRGYSNPDILVRSTSSEIVESASLSQEEEKIINLQVDEDLIAVIATTAPPPPPSFTRRLSSNIVGFRRRHQQQQQEVVEDDIIPDEHESYFPLDTTNTNKKEVLLETTTTTTAMAIEDTVTGIATTNLPSVSAAAITQVKQVVVEEEEKKSEQIIIQQNPLQQQNDSSSITSTKTTSNNKLNMISKVIGSKISSSTTKIINNHPNTTKKSTALYHMAGSIFTKKSSNSTKVTKEMRDERNRELQESHNRKMMNLFIQNEAPSSPVEPVVAAQKAMPPPLPPRPNIATSSSSSASSLLSSNSEEEASSPEELVTSGLSKKEQKEQFFIVNHQEEQHGLSL